MSYYRAMWSNWLHPSFLRGVGAGLSLAIVLRWLFVRFWSEQLVHILKRHGRADPASFLAATIRENGLSFHLANARRLLNDWIGLSIRFERVIHGDDAAGGAAEVEEAALRLRKRTFRVLEPDGVDQVARPPGPPATVG